MLQQWARAFRDQEFYAAVDTNNGTEAMNKLFKYKFMSKRKSFTLSALVIQLTERFLPDLQRNYVMQNLKGSAKCRSYKDFVPDYLHGRPRSVIIHCLDRKCRANKYDDEDIHFTDQQGVFKIKKGESFKHVIDFLKPSCTCKDWIHWRIPCKHFLQCLGLNQNGVGELYHKVTLTVLIFNQMLKQFKNTLAQKQKN